MSLTPDDAPAVGDYLESMDPRAKLVRKVRVLKAMAVIETVSYCCLLVPMFRKYLLDDHTTANYLVLRIIAYFHGMVAAAFAVMSFDVRKPLRWSWGFFVVTLLGPPGALITHWRLRHDPLPDVVSADDMFF
jgi:integral membrane protein